MHTLDDWKAADAATDFVTVEESGPVLPVDPSAGDNGDDEGSSGCALNPGAHVGPSMVGFPAILLGIRLVGRDTRRDSLRGRRCT